MKKSSKIHKLAPPKHRIWGKPQAVQYFWFYMAQHNTAKGLWEERKTKNSKLLNTILSSELNILFYCVNNFVCIFRNYKIQVISLFNNLAFVYQLCLVREIVVCKFLTFLLFIIFKTCFITYQILKYLLDFIIIN